MSTPDESASVVRRATEDPDFRERLLTNPTATLSELLGDAIPDDVEVVVVENTSTRIHILLPDENLAGGEEDVMARVSAGFGQFCHELHTRPPWA